MEPQKSLLISQESQARQSPGEATTAGGAQAPGGPPPPGGGPAERRPARLCLCVRSSSRDRGQLPTVVTASGPIDVNALLP